MRAHGQLFDRLHHALADTACRHVDHAPEAHIVVRVDDQPHVGERVLDLLSLVEPDSADHLVGDAFAHQRVFNRSRLRVGAVEDRHRRFHVVGQRRPGGSRDEVRLFQLVAAAEVQDAIATLAIGPQVLVLAVAILADDCGRGIQDDLRRAVVSFELDDLGFAEVLLEVEDVAQVGPPPLVNRLIGIADDGDVAVRFGKTADQQVLRTVGVLVLVDHHVLEFSRVELPDLLRGFEELHRFQEQVVEVERIRVGERLQVALVDLCDVFVANVPAAAQRLRPFHAVLRLTDPRKRHPGRDELVVDPQLALRLLDHGDLVGRVVDHEVARQANLRRLAAQQSRAQRVKRREPDALGRRTDERLDALTHFLRRLVGERDREHFIRVGVAVADQVRDPKSNYARLARARTREDEQRPVAMQHGLALFRIQFFEEIHGGISL